jgi:tRNA pseudouridine38-40 synthase
MLRVAYDGTNYCGWQLQPNAVTIEGILNQALTELLQTPIRVIGTSRTDAGVHALGNAAVFDTDTRIPPEKICMALNARLPEDIVVQSSEQVPDDFHPRRCVSEKTYEYQILSRKRPLPSMRHHTHYTWNTFDVEKMREAAGILVGEHDFKGFCSIKTQAESTVRTIYSITVEERELQAGGSLISIRVTGSGFLYNMVRIIAGTLMEAGMGKRSMQTIREAVETGERTLAGPTAPAKGLTLIGIKFEGLEKND